MKVRQADVHAPELLNLRTSGAVLLHDNVHHQIAASTEALLGNFNWELFGRPPYIPDVTESDYHLLT
jgi:hypothetical protein